jgi:putative ABC transport system permease protein
MFNILKIATRNLLRYQRRSLLTALLITIGITAVLLFVSVSGSFKTLMVGQITDSMLGHLQIHRKGYVASLDNLPLNLNMKPAAVAKVEQELNKINGVEAWSPRIKFGAMFSNFTETTSIRLNAVDPAREIATVPMIAQRVVQGSIARALVEPGKILVPELIARGMKVKVGDTVVIVATNPDGAVNGMTFVVQGILEGISGPGGRDGYMNINDARSLLRLTDDGVSEIAVRLKDPSMLHKVEGQLKATLGQMTNQQGKPAFEIHDWTKLSPFSNIAEMIDMLTLFIKIMLVAIVLISIMNVMIMAVYERMREIGTISAIGTLPGKVLSLFIAEGLLLAVAGTLIGITISLVAIYALNLFPLSFDFGRQTGLVLEPSIDSGEILTIALLVIGVSVLASLQPAWKASRTDPIHALRSV